MVQTAAGGGLLGAKVERLKVQKADGQQLDNRTQNTPCENGYSRCYGSIRDRTAGFRLPASHQKRVSG